MTLTFQKWPYYPWQRHERDLVRGNLSCFEMWAASLSRRVYNHVNHVPPFLGGETRFWNSNVHITPKKYRATFFSYINQTIFQPSKLSNNWNVQAQQASQQQFNAKDMTGKYWVVDETVEQCLFILLWHPKNKKSCWNLCCCSLLIPCGMLCARFLWFSIHLHIKQLVSHLAVLLSLCLVPRTCLLPRAFHCTLLFSFWWLTLPLLFAFFTHPTMWFIAKICHGTIFFQLGTNGRN